jgi:hypothetical protein
MNSNTTKSGEQRQLQSWEVKIEYIHKDDLAGLIHTTLSSSGIPQDLFDDILDRLSSYQPDDDLFIPLTLSQVVGALANGQRIDAEKTRTKEEAEMLENSPPFKDAQEVYLAEVAAAKKIAEELLTFDDLEKKRLALVELLKFIKNDEENHFDLNSALLEWLEPQPDETNEYMNFNGMYLGEVFGCLSIETNIKGALTLEVEQTREAKVTKSTYVESTENFSVKVIYLSEAQK